MRMPHDLEKCDERPREFRFRGRSSHFSCALFSSLEELIRESVHENENGNVLLLP